ncbi:hypothetical protein V500_01660 [Pseudogymnoascus sp. VKM F-4518 (FW-2643)]|nr:hypothetical protein V500_01660 [Pseudogymnoascus sp. VKM F-4518 (FW-2643)]
MTIEDTCATRAEKPQVALIPWDPQSPEHCERLYQQRVACGWKMDKIETWRKYQREGKMSIHWIVLLTSNPRSAAMLAQHAEKYPNESTAIFDSAVSIGGHQRDSSSSCSAPFVPVGHISIDTIASTVVPSCLLANPKEHRLHISAFYVSNAIQGGGIGGAAMKAAEHMAVVVLGARVLTLDTMDKRVFLPVAEGGINGGVDSYLKYQRMEVPKFSAQSWYERMNYEVFKEVPEQDEGNGYVATLKTDDGKIEKWCTPSVWMEKRVD